MTWGCCGVCDAGVVIRSDGSHAIEACGACRRFETDEDAHELVAALLQHLERTGAASGVSTVACALDALTRGHASPDGRLFIHGAITLCPDCIPASVDLGADGVETWEVGSAGWTRAPICDGCQIAIAVVVDA